MLFILTLVMLFAALALCAVRHMHFFQLNSYKFAEHKVWIGRNAPYLVFLSVLSLLALVALPFGEVWGAVICLAIILIYALAARPKSRKSSKKPLVFTPRVIRMLVTEFIFYAVTALVFCLFAPIELLPIYVAAALFICPHVCLLANIINAPIEKTIRNGYTKEAVAMLRAHPSLKIVGITGSYGKTSSKYYLNALLSEKFDVLMTPGSYNTPLGVVKTVRESLRPTHEVFICEMGAKYVGDIEELCLIAEPDIGIITSIGAQHLETFGSLENIIGTKLELADYLSAKGKKVVLNGDCSLITENSDKYAKNRILCGRGEGMDLTVSDIRADEKGTSFTVKMKDGVSFPISVNLLGEHNVSNVAAAIAVAYELGMTPEEIARASKRIKCAPHRLEIKRSGSDMIIDDAYNANPAGTKAALAALALFEGCKMIITPGMVELGAESDAFNKALGADAAKVCDYIFLVGSFKSEVIRSGAIEAGYPEEKVRIFERVEDAINAARALITNDRKIILLENDLPDNY